MRGSSKELIKMEQPNCDIWGIVDFGKGDVEVRCTQLGPHEDHICQVLLAVDEAEPPIDVVHRNVFDRKVS